MDVRDPVYWATFYVANRHTRISRGEVNAYIRAINSPWVLCALLGLYVSVCLIVDGNSTALWAIDSRAELHRQHGENADG